MIYGNEMSFGIAYTVLDTGKVSATGLGYLTTYYITQHGPMSKWTIIYEDSILRKPKYLYHCIIPWIDRNNPMYYWDTLCANAIELFGLPGDRYITDISEHSMTWSFRQEHDALLFKLKFAEAVC